MNEPEPTYPSAEQLMKDLGPDRTNFMREMIGDIKYKPGEEETGEFNPANVDPEDVQETE